jgi:colanic acid/amylovoran biosynthesis protein
MKTIKQLIFKLLDNTALKYWVAVCISAIKTVKKDSSRPQFSVLIPAPGGGNIGDQAMLESFLKNVDGHKLIIKTNANTIDIPAKYAANVQVIEMPGLIYGHLIKFVKDFLKLQTLMSSTRALYVIGADIMDGGYNKNASALRSYIAYFFAKNNIPARIFGFSWNSSPDPLALSAIKKAASHGVVLCARDPLSFERLEKAGVQNIRQVADMVFANESTQTDGIEDILDFCANKKIAIVNASGLIAKNIDQLNEYSKIINKLTDKGYTIVLLPHVIRPGANDLPICQALSKKYPDAFLVERLLQPDQVKRLAQEAKIVVTGRMHLSIMSLNQLVPSIVLSTQGKVDGLMALFEVKELSVEPVQNFGTKVSDLIEQIDARYNDYKSSLSRNISLVRSLSARNFDK